MVPRIRKVPLYMQQVSPFCQYIWSVHKRVVCLLVCLLWLLQPRGPPMMQHPPHHAMMQQQQPMRGMLPPPQMQPHHQPPPFMQNFPPPPHGGMMGPPPKRPHLESEDLIPEQEFTNAHPVSWATLLPSGPL